MALSIFEIPLSPKSQTFSITLGGTSYKMSVIWRAEPTGMWFLDIADFSGTPIVSGLAMVPGADLLGQFKHLGIGGGLIVLTDDAPAAMPTYNNLGIQSHLYFIQE